MADLRAKYGGAKHNTINRAIRAEIPGGAVVLDRLQDWHHICVRLGWDGVPEPLHVTAYRHLLEIVDAMEDEIRRRYEMPRPTPRHDLSR